MRRISEHIKKTFSYKFFSTAFLYLAAKTESLGVIVIDFLKVLILILQGKLNAKRAFEQAYSIGFGSLLISLSMVGVAGMIIALQLAQEMVKQGAGDYVGALVSVAIVREIGPVIGSFAVIALAGSAMAAEIATMKVNEQTDAMFTLGVNPISYLIVPRVIAGFLIVPFLIILADFAGVMLGMYISNLVSGLTISSFLDSVWRGLQEKDVYVSLLKGSVFGGLIALISSSVGYSTRGGAKEVGEAVTNAVVWSFVAVVLFDYLISFAFFY